MAARSRNVAQSTGQPGQPSQASQAGKSNATARLKKKDATRQQLINATVDAIAVGGFADLTLSEVSRRAAVSRGLVNFHFDSKDQLLVETLAYLTNEYLQSWQRAVDRAGEDPAAELLALVRNDFHSKVCNRKKIAVWFAFRGEAKSRPTYVDVCTKADEAFDQTLTALCARLVEEGDYSMEAGAAATGLRAMIEGLWLEFLMSPQGLTREEALAITGTFLTALFPRHFQASDFRRLPAEAEAEQA